MCAILDHRSLIHSGNAQAGLLRYHEVGAAATLWYKLLLLHVYITCSGVCLPYCQG